MDIAQALQEVGLNQRESEVYLTLLQIGQASILDIAKNCQIKRPTVYSAMASLESKGLVHRIPLGKRVRYVAESVESLQLLLQSKQKTLSWLVPQLNAIQNVPRGTKPEIRYYEGKEALISMYKTYFMQINEGETIYFITSLRDLLRNFPEMLDYFNTQAKKWQWKTREIVPQNKIGVDYALHNLKTVSMSQKHKIRLLPKNLDLFDMEIVLAGDALIFSSFRNEIFAVTIKCAHFAESFRSIFRALWLVCSEPPVNY